MNKPLVFAGRTYQWLQIGQSYELRNMFRVVHAGKLSDMTNLTRAKDAALSLAARALEAHAKPRNRPPVSRDKKAGTQKGGAKRGPSASFPAPHNPSRVTLADNINPEAGG
jgi:hypothetical protein